MSMDWWLSLDYDFKRRLIEFGLGRSIRYYDDRMLDIEFHANFIEISTEYLQCNCMVSIFDIIEKINKGIMIRNYSTSGCSIHFFHL